MKSLGFTYDKKFCSAQRRAVQTATLINSGFGGDQKVEIILNCHENKGPYYKKEIKAGLTL